MRRAASEFLELLEPVQDGLFNYARRMVWQADLAEDVVQETVMIAWREFGRFRRGTDFHAWVFRILIHTLYRFNRRAGRRRERPLSEAPEWGALLAREDAWEALRQQPGRLREMLDQRLAQAIDGLDDQQRECLLLRLVGGLRYREIAGLLDMPVGTVMSHVHRARMSLRERLAALALEEGIVSEAAHELP